VTVAFDVQFHEPSVLAVWLEYGSADP